MSEIKAKMKWLPWLIALIVMSAGINIYFLVSHRGGGTEASTPESSGQLYVCPMHPQVTDDHASDCPICGMKLVPVKHGDERTASPAAHKIAFYRSPMDPNVTSPTPRKDEMGMDYVPVYEDELGGGESTVAGRATVTIDPDKQQLIGLRTAPAVRGQISGGWRTVGRVESNPTTIGKVTVKVAGYVEKVMVDFVGRPVHKGEALFTFYSPELYTAQQDYLLARRINDTTKTSSDNLLVVTARQKLKLWDMTDEQIKGLDEKGEALRTVTFVSPVAGVVTAKNVVEGSALNPGETAYEVSDLSTVWVMADAYQSDVEQAKVGLPVSVGFAAMPDRVLAGRVTFVDPVLDPQTLTFKVRIVVENKAGDLKPGMFAEVQFRTPGREALTIPVDAVIPSGRGNYVFVSIGDGRFEPRAVTLGQRSEDQVEVLDGLSERELVVTRANFLVDSESSLRAALATVRGS